LIIRGSWHFLHSLLIVVIIRKFLLLLSALAIVDDGQDDRQQYENENHHHCYEKLNNAIENVTCLTFTEGVATMK
jgi:hypothetical protein